jgi:hypothetical protein
MITFLSHVHTRSRHASAAGAAALLFIGPSLAFAPDAQAARVNGASIYDISVVSNGMAIHIHDPNLVLQPDVAFGPYAALASLDNLGASSATAGAPFLGDYVGPLVGHFNGLGSGQIPPFPPVPGEVHSSYPGQPSALQRNGGYSVQAASSERESKAAVNLGAATPGANNATLFSLAHVLADASGTLNATGSSGVDTLNIGGVLDIGRVSSSITMSDPGSGGPKFVTTTDVGTISVSGQKFGLNQGGLTAAGTNSGSSADQVNAATQSLKQAGISIRYIPSTVTYAPGTQTVQSLESGAVEISDQHDVPSQGVVTTTYTLGYVKLITTTQNASASDAAQIADEGSNVSGAGSSNPAAPGLSPRWASLKSAVSGPAASAARAPVHPAQVHAADADGPSVAIITPTLRILRFGAKTGTPDSCNIFFGVLGAGATQAGVGAGSAPALSSAVEQCSTMSNSWGEQISGAMPQVAPLAVINPAVNPGIDAFADALESLGRDRADSVAPFGPTIVGLASSARFFKG